MVTVEPEVEAGAEVEAGVADRLDGDRPRGAVEHRRLNDAAEDAPVVRIEAQFGTHGRERFDPAVGMFDATLEARLLVAEDAQLPVLVMDRVATAVGALEQHRAPREAKVQLQRRARRPRPRRRPAGRRRPGARPTSDRGSRTTSRSRCHGGRRQHRPIPRRHRSGDSAALRHRDGSPVATAARRAVRARVARPPRTPTRTRSAPRRSLRNGSERAGTVRARRTATVPRRCGRGRR